MENIEIDISQRKKKGRPRKIQESNQTEQTEQVVKKRGRKPNPIQPIQDALPVIIKKRGRKPIASFYNTLGNKFDKSKIQPLHNNYRDVLQLELDVLDTDVIFHEDSLGNVLGDYISNKDDVFTTITDGVENLALFSNPKDTDTITDTITDTYIITDKDTIKDTIKDTQSTNLKKIEELYLSKINTRLEEDLKLIDEKKNMLIDFDENHHVIGLPVDIENESSFEFDQEIKSYKFYGKNTQKTKSACHWCCHSFNTIPLGLPVIFNKNLLKFKTRFNFCSMNCVLAYNNDYKLPYRYLVLSMFKIIGEQLDVNNIYRETNLIPALPKQMLNLFGGPYSIEEYRKNHNIYTYKSLNYPFYPSRDYIQELSINKVKELNSDVFIPASKPKEKITISSFLVYD